MKTTSTTDPTKINAMIKLGIEERFAQDLYRQLDEQAQKASAFSDAG